MIRKNSTVRLSGGRIESITLRPHTNGNVITPSLLDVDIRVDFEGKYLCLDLFDWYEHIIAVLGERMARY